MILREIYKIDMEFIKISGEYMKNIIIFEEEIVIRDFTKKEDV